MAKAELDNSRKKVLGQVAKGIEVVDLDAWVPESKPGSDVDSAIPIKEEDEEEPKDKARTNRLNESIEDTNKQSPESTTEKNVSVTPNNSAEKGPEDLTRATEANMATSVPTTPPVPVTEPEQGLPQLQSVSDPMDVDLPEPQDSNPNNAVVGDRPQASSLAANDSEVMAKPGPPHVGRKPIERVHSESFRQNLRTRQQEAAKMMAARMQAQNGSSSAKTQQAHNVSTKPFTGKSGRGPKSSKHPATTDDLSHVGRNHAPDPTPKTCATYKQQTASGGEYPSDYESSDRDDDHSDGEEGLFVTESAKRPHHASDHDDHEDVDMNEEFDDAEWERKEEKEFFALEKKLKKMQRALRKKAKKGELVTDEEEILAMQLKHEYTRALQKRKRIMEDEHPSEDDGMFAGHGGGDVDDDDLFVESFEGRRLKTPPANGKSVDFGSEDEEDPLEEYDRQAKANRANTSKHRRAGGYPSGDELVGSRKKNTITRSPRQKKTGGNGRKKKAAATNIVGDQVQDPNARIQKSKKTKKPKPGAAPAHPMLNMQSLFTADVIRDARGNAGLGALPGLTSRNRQDALNALVASLPPEHRINARTDKKSLLSAMRDFGGNRAIRAVPGELGGYHIKGMVSHLRPHQLLGSAFMRRRENDTVTPRGGICADQMGLGKTVMMIANILDGRPKPKDDGPRTTLIVATIALCNQWKKEIAKHTQQDKNKLKVLLYAHKHMRTSDPVENIQSFDVVITTYDEVRKSYPKAEFPLGLQTADEKQKWWKDYYESHRGDLHKVDFLRVVLDEAQQIKNHRSHTSIACRGLTARHRWALSGTPIQNSIKELYPYFKFLRVEHTGSYKVFCQNFVGNDKMPSKLGLNRLNQLLNRFMIRRTHADKVMGAPIVILPKASEQVRWVRFNDVERSIYEIVRSRMIKRINKLSRSKELDANYSHVLTMLLRLRQLTGHILMAETAMRDLLEMEDHEKIYELATMENTDVKSSLRSMQLKRIRHLLAKGAKDDVSRPGRTKFPGVQEKQRRHDSADPHNDQEGDRDVEVETLPNRDNIGGKHGVEYDFLKYLETLRDSNKIKELNDRTTCVYCGDTPTDPRLTTCYHIYCEGCLEHLMEEAVSANLDGARCRDCGVEFTNTSPCNKMNFNAAKKTGTQHGHIMDELEESDSEDEMLKHKRQWKSKGDKNRKEDWIDQEGKNILPSAKTIEIKAQVLNWIAENPHVKIIIFTQFINMIRILQKVCSAEGWAYTLYHGGINMTQRQENIEKFAAQPTVRILLASLKAGGIGLNLTMAQKVIVVDPWWNSSVEQQAFCRVFRIGQEHETSLTRFVVENTVDQNMIEMQQRKQEEIDQVMDTKKVSGKRLEIKELLALFGNEVGEDEDGQPFIIVKNQETCPNPMAGDEEIGDSE